MTGETVDVGFDDVIGDRVRQHGEQLLPLPGLPVTPGCAVAVRPVAGTVHGRRPHLEATRTATGGEGPHSCGPQVTARQDYAGVRARTMSVPTSSGFGAARMSTSTSVKPWRLSRSAHHCGL